jgi:K+/H+ antiporter YhaU regulatory subunit KhtT
MLIVVASVFIITALVALVRQVFRLIEEASLPIHSPGSKKRALKDTISYQVLRALVVMGVIIGSFLLFTFMGAPFAYTPVYLLTLAITVVALAYVFKHSVTSFNERFKTTISDGFRVKEEEAPREGPAASTKDLAVPQLLSEGDNLCNVVVDATSEDRGKPLRETTLWNREGVSVLAIRRDDELFIDPDEDEVLKEKDVLIILECDTVKPRDQPGPSTRS